jgi:hypothetical protein
MTYLPEPPPVLTIDAVSVNDAPCVIVSSGDVPPPPLKVRSIVLPDEPTEEVTR